MAVNPFRKAEPKQAAIKMGLYGPPGSGKTLTSLLIAKGLAKACGKRIAFVDTERGSDFYTMTVQERTVHPEGFDFDALYTRSITEVTQAIIDMESFGYGVMIIDSITHIWEAALAAYGGKRTRIDTIPISAWGAIKKPYKALMNALLSSPMHTIICGRQKNEWETDERGELHKVGVQMKAEGETPYEPHILIRMECERPTAGNISGTIRAFAEKDRTGILTGKIFTSPTFADLAEPILPLLGLTQAKVPDADETANEDHERLQEQNEATEEDSAKALKMYRAKIDLCVNLDQFKALNEEISKVKKTMVQGDITILRETFLEAQETLKKDTGSK